MQIKYTSISAGGCSCPSCGEGRWLCDTCIADHSHGVVQKRKRKMLSLQDINEKIAKRCASIGWSEEQADVFNAVCELFEVKDPIEFQVIINQVKVAPLRSEAQYRFCATCRTIIVFYRRMIGRKCFCMSCASTGEIQRRLTDGEVANLENFMKRGFKHQSSIELPKFFESVPSTSGGFVYEESNIISEDKLYKMLEELDDVSIKTELEISSDTHLPQHILTRLRSKRVVYFKFTLRVSEGSNSKLFDLVDAMRVDDFGYKSSPMTRIQESVEDSTLIFIGNEGSGTPWHCDRARARNLAFAVDEESQVVSRWVFFHRRHFAQVNACLLEMGCGGVNSNVLLSIPQTVELQRKAGVFNKRQIVVLIDQKPGEVVAVPNGWFHQVRNMAKSLKVAWDYLIPREFCEYISTLREVGSRRLVPQVSDYSPLMPFLQLISTE